MREIRLALLEADVSYVVKDFVKSVSSAGPGMDVMESLTPGADDRQNRQRTGSV